MIGLDTDPNVSGTMRMHWQVAHYTFSVIWGGKSLIGKMVIGAILLTAGVLVLMPLQYTSEAVIQLNFNRHEPTNKGGGQPIATLDPAALVDGEVRLIRSWRTLGAVVTQLGLDKDGRFTGQSRLSVGFTWLRAVLPGASASPTPHDRAVATLMQTVRVQNQPRSYLISVIVTATDADQAQSLANAVAMEYLRVTAIRTVAAEEADAQAEIAALSSVFGQHHPSLRRGMLRLELLHKKADLLRNARSAEDIRAIAGEGPAFIPADKSSIPSGPNGKLTLTAAALVGFAGGVFLVLRRHRRGGLMLSTVGTGLGFHVEALRRMKEWLWGALARQQQGRQSPATITSWPFGPTGSCSRRLRYGLRRAAPAGLAAARRYFRQIRSNM